MLAKRFVFDLYGCCVKHFVVSVDDADKIMNVLFVEGCPGYLRKLSSELEGATIDEAIAICDENVCGPSKQNCSVLLCQALKQKFIWLKENV